MKLYFLRQSALDMLRRDVSQNLKYYAGAAMWLEEYFDMKNISNYSFDSGIEVADFELLPGGPETDAQNAKILYESLRGKLNRIQGTDFRLWSGLTHTVAWSYMKTRWALDEGKQNEWPNRITDRYFISSRSPYVRNGISRLYWSAELTYDDENDNPYEYLEYVLKWQDLAVGALDRQIGRAKESILGNLQALKEADLNEDDRRLFFTKINQYGGIKLLDAISREQSLDVSRKYIEYIISLPLVENGKELTLKNIENGRIMKCMVDKGKLMVGNAEIKTTGRLLRRRKGSVIEANQMQWQIAAVN